MKSSRQEVPSTEAATAVDPPTHLLPGLLWSPLVPAALHAGINIRVDVNMAIKLDPVAQAQQRSPLIRAGLAHGALTLLPNSLIQNVEQEQRLKGWTSQHC